MGVGIPPGAVEEAAGTSASKGTRTGTLRDALAAGMTSVRRDGRGRWGP